MPDRLYQEIQSWKPSGQSEAFVDDNTLSVNINRLRKKLDVFSLPQLIHTKKGIGYQLYYEDIH